MDRMNRIIGLCWDGVIWGILLVSAHFLSFEYGEGRVVEVHEVGLGGIGWRFHGFWRAGARIWWSGTLSWA